MKRPLAVLLVAGPATGGTRTHVSDLARRLADRDVAVTVAAPEVTLTLLRQPPADPRIRLHALPVGGRSPGAAPAAHRRLRRLQTTHDVVHAHGLRAAVAAAAARGAVPLVATWHNAATATGVRLALHRRLERYSATRCDVVLAVSPDLADRARQAGARRVRRIEVPAPALLPAQREPAQLRRDLDLPVDRPLVLSLARLERQKRLDVLVAAAAGWSGRQDPFAVVAGDGPQRAALQRQITAASAPVRLLGARSDVADLLAAAAVVALPSAWEGWPLAAAEAIRAGVPLVCSDRPGLRALAGEAAVYVPVGDPTALRHAVERVLSDATLRGDMTAAGRRQRASWQSIDDAVDELVRIYLDVSSTSSQ